MEFLRKTKLDADLPTKTKKGEEETEVGEKKGEVIGHVGRRRGRGGEKRMGGVGGRAERNHPCVPPGLPCKSAGTSTSVLDAFTLHLLSASQPFLLHRILETYWSSCPFSDLAWSLSSQDAFLHSLFPLSEMLFPLSTTTLYTHLA